MYFGPVTDCCILVTITHSIWKRRTFFLKSKLHIILKKELLGLKILPLNQWINELEKDHSPGMSECAHQTGLVIEAWLSDVMGVRMMVCQFFLGLPTYLQTLLVGFGKWSLPFWCRQKHGELCLVPPFPWKRKWITLDASSFKKRKHLLTVPACVRSFHIVQSYI